MTTYGSGKYGTGTYADPTATSGGGDTVTAMNLHEDMSKRTNRTVTLVWDAQTDISGYLFKKNGKIVSQGTNPAQVSAKLAAVGGDKLEVIPTRTGEALTIT